MKKSRAWRVSSCISRLLLVRGVQSLSKWHANAMGIRGEFWFFRALLSEILVGWLVDAERRGRYICRRKIYIPRPRFCFYPFPTRDRARHASGKKQLCIGIRESATPRKSIILISYITRRIKIFSAWFMCISTCATESPSYPKFESKAKNMNRGKYLLAYAYVRECFRRLSGNL